MNKISKYYKVRMNDGTENSVSSLAKAKQLIHGKKDWTVSHFSTDGTIGGIKCINTTWYNHYELLRKHKWKLHNPSGFDRLALSLRKSRIAK